MLGYSHLYITDNGPRTIPPKEGHAVEVLAFGTFGHLDEPTEDTIVPSTLRMFYRVRKYDDKTFGNWRDILTGLETEATPAEQSIAELERHGYTNVLAILPIGLVTRRLKRRLLDNNILQQGI